jgi:excisionase family DNA binding protein
MFEDYADVVTVKELCRMLKIGRNTAYDLLKSGQIPSVSVGRQHRISKIEVQAFLLRNRDKAIETADEKCYNNSNQYQANSALSSERSKT